MAGVDRSGGSEELLLPTLEHSLRAAGVQARSVQRAHCSRKLPRLAVCTALSNSCSSHFLPLSAADGADCRLGAKEYGVDQL